MLFNHWCQQDLLLEGQQMSGSGAEPLKIVFDYALYFGYDVTNAPFIA